MTLPPMRYKDYIWPHNPSVYTIAGHRQTAVLKVPFGPCFTQDLGMTSRIMRGEGAFVGENAYEDFRRLEAVFRSEGPGLLIHPLWQPASAYFIDLQLMQEPAPDFVRYSFAFLEAGEDPQAASRSPAGNGRKAERTAREPAVCTAVHGDTLWSIAARHGTEVRQLLALNPQIKNPNLIRPGDKVVLPC